MRAQPRASHHVGGSHAEDTDGEVIARLQAAIEHHARPKSGYVATGAVNSPY